MTDEIHLWFWIITSDRTGKRVKTTWRMIEGDARQRHGGDAVKVEDSLEVRQDYGSTGDFLREH